MIGITVEEVLKWLSHDTCLFVSSQEGYGMDAMIMVGEPTMGIGVRLGVLSPP